MNISTYSPTTFADTLWRRDSLLKNAILVLLGSWLIALLAQVAIPFVPVPITGQTFGVLLVAMLLGSRRGFLSVAVYIAQGALGLPIFAAGTAGVVVLLGPTGGYLAGMAAAAWVIGWLSERGWDRRFGSAALAMLVGTSVIYLFGLTWLAQFAGASQVLSLGLYPFLIGDVLKIVLAATLLPSGWYWLTRFK